MYSYIEILGLLWISISAYKLVSFIYLHVRPSSLDRYNYKNGDRRPWAFITGSSDGIGLGFAHSLAESGFNIILHGRNPTKLENARKVLSREYPGSEFRFVVADVCESEPQMLARIEAIVQELQDLHLTVLVNNVGGAPPGMEPLYKTLDANTATDVEGLLSMNIRFTVHLTRSIIPLFTKRQTPSLIITIGSMSDIGLPWLSIYAGSKAFVMSWSTALAREMKAEKRNIEVLGIVPTTVTNVSFRKVAPTLMQPDIRTFARASLGKVGSGRTVVPGYWVHHVILTVVNWLPESVRFNILANSVRKEAEKDKKRD